MPSLADTLARGVIDTGVLRQPWRDEAERLRRFQAAVNTLATNESTQVAWELFLQALIETVLLEEVPADHVNFGDAAIYQNGRASVVKQIIATHRAALGR